MTRDPNMIQILQKNLPRLIAETLNVEEDSLFRLKPENVEVRFEHASHHDVNGADLSIIILANTCPQRVDNLDWRDHKILTDLRAIICDEVKEGAEITVYVWTQLVQGAYGITGV